MSKFRLKGQTLRHISGTELRGDIDYGRPSDAPAYNSKKFDLTVDTVCEACNQGWMSDLEAQGSPLLTPMIEGKTTGLSVQQQAQLAAWVTKTALTWDQSLRPESRFQPPWLYHWLYEHRGDRVAPPGVTVRLGRYEGAHELLVEMVHDAMYLGVPDDLDDPGPPDANRTIIRVKHLVMEFMATRDTRPRFAVFERDIRPMVVTIWPATDRTAWPPPVSFDATTLDGFTDADRLTRPQ